MSSPARPSVSATSVGQGCGVGGSVDEPTGTYQLPPDGIFSAYERKDEALAALKSELMEALQREVKSLDEDAWMFAGPRSQIQRISRPADDLPRNFMQKHFHFLPSDFRWVSKEAN